MPLGVVMPALEMAQETGKLISWFKKEGDSVAKGEPLLEIETDKAVVEVESPGDGMLAGVKAQVGDEIPVGQTIAWILRPGESVPATELHIETGRKTTASVTPLASKKPIAQPHTNSGEVKASPKARRLAAERGVDLSEVRGTGPSGEILAADILQSAEASVKSSLAAHSSPVSRLMAERTAQSWTTIPHFFVTRDIDGSELVRERERRAPEIEKAHSVKLTLTDLLISIVARVLVKHSTLNSTWRDQSVQISAEVNIGVAVAAEDGVVAPVIHRADKVSLGEIAAQRRDLADRVVSHKDAPAVRPMITFTLSSDHRVVDGARAAEFLSGLNQPMEKPESVLE